MGAPSGEQDLGGPTGTAPHMEGAHGSALCRRPRRLLPARTPRWQAAWQPVRPPPSPLHVLVRTLHATCLLRPQPTCCVHISTCHISCHMNDMTMTKPSTCSHAGTASVPRTALAPQRTNRPICGRPTNGTRLPTHASQPPASIQWAAGLCKQAAGLRAGSHWRARRCAL